MLHQLNNKEYRDGYMRGCEEERTRILAIVNELRGGEMTAQEQRTVLAVLKSISSQINPTV